MLHRVVIFSALIGFGVLSAFSETYKNSYSIACTDIWPAVKATLADQEHYAKVIVNDERMKADYQPKHTVHVDVSGTLLQRTNHVTLIPKDGVWEMDVVSNYSGWGHDDKADFKKRVDDNLTKTKAPPVPSTTAPAAAQPAATDEQKPQERAARVA
jgi:hypothetical protein